MKLNLTKKGFGDCISAAFNLLPVWVGFIMLAYVNLEPISMIALIAWVVLYKQPREIIRNWRSDKEVEMLISYYGTIFFMAILTMKPEYWYIFILAFAFWTPMHKALKFKRRISQ